MANLELIKVLNKKYKKQSPFTYSNKSFTLNEAFSYVNSQKAIRNFVIDLGDIYETYFLEGKEADVVLLFIDVCSFSSRYRSLNSDQIASYFDEYYNLVIPVIYQFGGEIDKIIGDGIICVFGKPFLQEDLGECIRKADACSKEIIRITINTKFNSKIAFHFGKIKYFSNKSGLYNELTMIGKPLTELFRLESVSEEDKINYYVEFKFYKEWNWNHEINKGTFLWSLDEVKEIPKGLKGIDYKYLQTNSYNL